MEISTAGIQIVLVEHKTILLILVGPKVVSLAHVGRCNVLTIGYQVMTFFCFKILSHPLKKYPGPFIATLTSGYGGYHASKKRLHLATFHDHAKYGGRFPSSFIYVLQLGLS